MRKISKKYSFFEIFQHWFLVLIFISLAITGFMQAKPFNNFSNFLLNLFGNLQNVTILHRFLGKLYTLYFLLHLIIMIFHFVKGNRGLLLRKVDFQPSEPGTKQRFTLRHKLDYYAVFFGSLVFIVTGIILMIPEFSASFIGGTGISIAREIHFNEAIIATCVIIFWHFFYAHFHPKVFPFNLEIVKTKKKK